MEKIKTRFAPSPTGSLHVGGARTALFNYCIARRGGGEFLLRIEDTDQARHQEEAVEKIVEDLRWLGLDWDEGVGKGGPAGPYRQSERLEIYQDHVRRLLEAGKAYYAFETPEELEAMREQSQKKTGGFRYPRPSELPSEADAEKARADDRPVVVRLLCPSHDVTIHDEVFGDVTVPADQLDDFVVRKANGWPTYHLANVVDDHLMGVNFVCRGQEFLGQTWRHALLREAFGYPEPKYAHLPLIMDAQGRKLSKRDGAVEVESFRREGYLPVTLVNFLALLGWNPGGQRERFTLEELVELFDVSRVGKTNPKFDRDKLLAFNTDIAAEADETRLVELFGDYLRRIGPAEAGGIPADDEDVLRILVASNRGFRTFADIVAKSAVLFGGDDAFAYDPKAVRKNLHKNERAGLAVLADIRSPLAEVEWTKDSLERWLADYCERKELGMGKVAQPIRVAVTGTNISPPIIETLLLLGRERTLARIDRCLAENAAEE